MWGVHIQMRRRHRGLHSGLRGARSAVTCVVVIGRGSDRQRSVLQPHVAQAAPGPGGAVHAFGADLAECKFTQPLHHALVETVGAAGHRWRTGHRLAPPPPSGGGHRRRKAAVVSRPRCRHSKQALRPLGCRSGGWRRSDEPISARLYENDGGGVVLVEDDAGASRDRHLLADPIDRVAQGAGQDVAAQPRTTSTGTVACSSVPRVTEPSSAPVWVPKPRVPITISSIFCSPA